MNSKNIKMNIELLKQESDRIEELIRSGYIDESGRTLAIPDGIVDVEKYCSSKIKILWILKEPYDDHENGIPIGGGWHFCRDFLKKPNLYSVTAKSHPTWHPITYVSFGILNSFMSWDEMSYIRENKAMMEVIQEIAVINIKKLPGLSRTNDYSNIEASYNRHKEIILDQISSYKPDVIIGGSTLKLLYKDLDVKQQNISRVGSFEITAQTERLLIHGYHPGQTQIQRKEYVDTIISSVKDWMALRETLTS